MRRRLQNSIAESTLTLPLAAVAATLLWWLPQGGYTTVALHAWFTTALTAYFVIETTTSNALLRTRSQMVAALVLLLLAVGGYLHTHHAALLAMLAMAMAHYYLLQTTPHSNSADDVASSRGSGRLGGAYPHRKPQVATFHAFAALSFGSLVWPPLLLFALPLLWSQAIYLRTTSWRCLGATVIGLVLPYLFWGTAVVLAMAINDTQTPLASLTHTAPPPAVDKPQPYTIVAVSTSLQEALSIDAFAHHCQAVAKPVAEPLVMVCNNGFSMPQPYNGWHQWQDILSWGGDRIERCSLLLLVALLALTGFVHYQRKSYDDKIRVRVCHHTFLTTTVVATMWLAMQPRHFAFLLPIIMLAMAPSAAHFIALTRTWLTNVWVVVLTVVLTVVGIVNLVPDIRHYATLAAAYVQQLL